MKSLKDHLDKYYTIQEEIYKYFGYKQKWQVFPIADETDSFWTLRGGEVIYADTKEELLQALKEDNGMCYSDYVDSSEIYRKEDYTMMEADTQSDGNKFLTIFDNTKEVKND